METVLNHPLVSSVLASPLLSGSAALHELCSFWDGLVLKPSAFSVSALIDSDPILSLTVFCLLCSTITWIMSVITGNCSQVDRSWSLIPFLYAWWIVFFDSLRAGELLPLDPRLLTIAILTTLWGLRLTYNFWRKGGYNPKDEDYRWPVLRRRIPQPFFALFNIVFISLYQNILLLLIAIPSYVCWAASHSNEHASLVFPNTADYVFAALFVLFLLGETIADQQQWDFQETKYKMIRAKQQRSGDFARGFLTRGLFRFTRHPNFLCEMGIWWCVYGFSVAATDAPFNWSVVGAVLLTLLFQGSTAFTEAITVDKYPDYKLYQKSTSRLLFWLPGKSLPDKKTKGA